MSRKSREDELGTAPAAGEGGSSRIRRRQRQRLIDACISAMHMYGPSRTTVEKVVALADLSPGIVRFYFDSKAAMLVASLEYLAREFEERVIQPVRALKSTPVQALRLLVELYFDADIASTRKVSVWYSFWGEASSRQEYYDICGGKDEDFAVLVAELIETLIRQGNATHLDPGAVALGLMGVLEVLWQGLAFQNETDTDRPGSVARSLAYLRSVFPGEFTDAAPPAVTRAAAANGRLPAWAYADAALHAAERDQLLRGAWQVLGHEAEIKEPGDFVTADLAGERVLVVRGPRGTLHALRNTCRQRPHALLATRSGHVDGAIRRIHGLEYAFDGRLISGDTPGDLCPFEVTRQGGVLLVRAVAQPSADEAVWRPFAKLVPGAVSDTDVRADWKIVVEQWLESLKEGQNFLPPNRLVESSEHGAFILQVTPVAPAHCRIRRFEFHTPRARRQLARGRGGAPGSWHRANSSWLKEQVELAESTQGGLAAGAEEVGGDGPVAPAIVQFRARILALLHALPSR